MIISRLMFGLTLCLLASSVQGRRHRRFQEIFDEDALANENEAFSLQPSDTEVREKKEFVPPGFATISEYSTSLPCGSQNNLSPGSAFMIQSPNFPSRPPRNTRCDWTFTLPAQAQVDLVCDFFNAPCWYRNSLSLAVTGTRTIEYCNKKSSQIFRNQRLVQITNRGNRKSMVLSFIIPRFFSRSGQGMQCRVIALGSSGPNPSTSTVAPTSTSSTVALTSTTQSSVATTTGSPAGCGIKSQGRIVGGNEATPNEWPWAVFIVIRTGSGNSFCGGTVISNQAVLTAAHCVVGSVRDVIVFFGCHLALRSSCERFIIAPAQNVRPHPSYINAASGRDVAVIQLPETLTFTNNIRPVCLPTSPNSNFAANSLWVAGWGNTSTNGSLSEALKEATLNRVPFSTCQNAFNENLANDILCTTTGSGTTCNGDSGSAVTNLRNGRYFVDGVVSFGRPKCEDDPSGNAEVFDNLGFINQFL